MTTLDDLIGISRRRPKERELCCPMCADSVVLLVGLLCCENSDCGWMGKTLAELAVKL